jgi:hypothetical protein
MGSGRAAFQVRGRGLRAFTGHSSRRGFLLQVRRKKTWFSGAALKKLVRKIQWKPELRAPASGPLDCHWGWGHVTAWRWTGGQPA